MQNPKQYLFAKVALPARITCQAYPIVDTGRNCLQAAGSEAVSLKYELRSGVRKIKLLVIEENHLSLHLLIPPPKYRFWGKISVYSPAIITLFFQQLAINLQR